jgi:hypothetical protein
MAVSPFDRLNGAKMPVFLEPKCSALSEYYHPFIVREKKS